MKKLNFLPAEVLEEIKKLETTPGFLNLKQVAVAFGVKYGTIRVFNMSEMLPKPDNNSGKGQALLWLPSTIAPFIQQYRKGK